MEPAPESAPAAAQTGWATWLAGYGLLTLGALRKLTPELSLLRPHRLKEGLHRVAGWAHVAAAVPAIATDLVKRESGTAHLEEAVAAYRAALEERTRERVPLDWAATQNNLGAVLQTLGERENGTARLEEAVAAYDRALAVFTAAKAEHYVDVAQANRERASRLIAERRGGGK